MIRNQARPRTGLQGERPPRLAGTEAEPLIHAVKQAVEGFESAVEVGHHGAVEGRQEVGRDPDPAALELVDQFFLQIAAEPGVQEGRGDEVRRGAGDQEGFRFVFLVVEKKAEQDREPQGGEDPVPEEDDRPAEDDGSHDGLADQPGGRVDQEDATGPSEGHEGPDDQVAESGQMHDGEEEGAEQENRIQVHEMEVDACLVAGGAWLAPRVATAMAWSWITWAGD